ncbi:oxidoreductase, NAD-binding domain protein [Corynebacterium efficiens YS-314]|uniref:Gfo/Idh/MocA-like oxidoreductase N-terminal domain-containing protein n=1 Tax=Corynebacterium efficiens (strain DSM 44549 / YS-314 / AJ 12310 / JCM 11189 / NBRC 100395) TaxID=196164 RepID=Q8FLR3_COREF|nr:Gfo/Idh/MocA family oxidoreductase [Corynebacterium efficiens]EEW50784.1 oxidoreductase, NAD-binding domain protein [Corynebacterium efficiens YS-314]BAC19610.1 hypothetical protein [Corynebacterium efficiens YS-314]
MRNAALVGCGDVAIVHWEAIEALGDELGIRLVAVVDSDPEAARAFSAQTGARAYGSLTELLAAGTVEVVHITTPHDQHIELTSEALASGAHVILEKPLAHEVAEARSSVHLSGVSVSPTQWGLAD